MSYTCLSCQKEFSTERNLNNHIKQNICTKKYICKKCQREFTSAHNLRSHLKRKIPCIPTEIPVIDLTQEKSKCHYCGNTYANKYSLRRHMGTCSMRNNQSAMMQVILKQNKMLMEQNQILIKQSGTVHQNSNIINNTINIQNNMYVNVTICSFGNEDLSKLDAAEVMKLLKGQVKDFMPKMIEHVHANPDHPEFHNVFYDPKREKAIVFAPISATEMSWQVREFQEVSDNLTEKIKDHIRPGSGPYFDMAAREKDYETSNRIIRIANQDDWKTDDMDEMTKESLTKVTKNKGFNELVVIDE